MGKIRAALAAIGPGLFMIGYNIGTGSVTTMAETGSKYGLTLLWAVVLSCLVTFVMLVAYGRFTLVTGETAISAFRRHLPLGNFLALYAMIALTFGELAALAGIMGILTSLIKEWTRILFGGQGANEVLTTVAILGGCFWLLWLGRYSYFEKFLSLLVAVMGASFLASAALLTGDPAALLSGLSFRMPSGEGAFINLAAIAGTTCGAMVFVMRSLVVAEKGWNVGDLRRERLDAAVSAGVMFLLSAAIMICASEAIFRRGGAPVYQAVDMVRMLEPLAGRYAISVLVVGIIGAGVSTIFPIALIAPWLVCDYTGRKPDLRSPLFRVLGAAGLMLGLTAPVFHWRPVWVMVASQAFQATILPAVTVASMLLLNDRKLMGVHKAGPWMNLGLVLTLLFSFFTSLPGMFDLTAALTRQAAGIAPLWRVVLVLAAGAAVVAPCAWIVYAWATSLKAGLRSRPGSGS
ncbi:Nramp family divalent metal transporter [bacterium]|nr:Nramp family divalent metal transporter [bacterium]